MPNMKFVKKLFYNVRDRFWNLPKFIFENGGILKKVNAFYMRLRPFSHIALFSSIFLVLGFINYFDITAVVDYQDDTLWEGVIIGNGGINRINPLLPTSNQLENDLSSLIYKGLVRVASNGDVQPVLAERWEDTSGKKKEYIFYLRKDVFWHDGSRFTADDVVATYNTLKAIGSGETSSSSKYTQTAENMNLKKINDYEIQVSLDKVNPTLFEDISWGILPKSALEDVNISTFSWGAFNMNPIGTGPYIFEGSNDKTITFKANKNYFLGEPKIENFNIILYETADEAVEALKGGRIHILADPSDLIVEDLEGWGNLEVLKSSSIYRRYWALYFNLKESKDTPFLDKQVRQAISSAINKKAIVEKLLSAGEIVEGPIPKNSWAFNEEAQNFKYDLKKARKLLKDAGWEQKELEGKKLLMKKDEVLRMQISYLDKYEREIVVNMIKDNLEELGVVVNLDKRSSSDLNEALIAPRNFETVLYGVETPIDPDRIRLWHGDAVEHPGLNISSYESEVKRGMIGESGKIRRVSVVDVALENARSAIKQETRIGGEGIDAGYAKFQEILLDEVPAVFLYHPVFTYVSRSRVKGIDLTGMTTPEDRYLNIYEWRIE